MYKALSRIHYKDSNAAIVVFDLTRRETFDNVQSWIDDLKDNSDGNIDILLLGNKLDIVNDQPKKRKIDEEEVEGFLEKFGCFKYGEVSAKSNENVDELVHDLLIKVKDGFLDRETRGVKNDVPGSDSITVGSRRSRNIERESKNSGDCC